MMLVLLLCIVMKIAEISVGRTSPTAPPPPPTCDSRRCRRCERYGSPPKRRHRRQSYGDNRRISLAREGVAAMEEPQTPGSDCNSNPATDSIQQDLVGSEFVQDNVEYQWFIDYGYRDGGLHIHPSVLSSLSASYTPKDLGYYDDLARNLDANLAEIDMESFRTADIHTLLTALPVMCTEPVQHSEFNYQREQYASISGSVMEKLDISSISPHTSSQGEDSACSTADTISICKSSLLFSPVKETPMLPPGGSYSVDSLDCEDMLLTCQTNNKNNYTIAFEGSMTMYSDGSQDFENHDKHKNDTYESSDIFYDKPKDMNTMLDLSMACSDSKIYTTWSNLKHSSMNKVITRHPSGNNNTIPDILQNAANLTLGRNKRSQSLPDLSRVREFQHTNIPLNFSVDSAESSNHMQRLHSSGSVMSRSTNAESSDNGENAGTKKLQNLSLVRLFMKQKSMSVEGMSLTLDQSDSVSDNSGWPTSYSGSDSANTQIQRQNGQDNTICDRRVLENDFSINWIKRDVTNNRDVENQRDSLNILTCAIRNKDDKAEMTSSASVEELLESTSKTGCISDQRNFDINHHPFEQKNGWVGLIEKKHPICRTTGIQANAKMEDNAVQTSLIFTTLRDKYGPLLQEATVNKKPVYVVYPNYTLPDLSFLKIKDHTKIDNIALKPHTFDRNKMEWKRTIRSSRPFSCNDIDALRQRGFAHIKDWESLTFLLPYEYKKILHDVPEVSRYININEEIKRPLFCLSPPMRHKTRPISEIIPTTTSSTSSTATQPSSGYRSSSTILTDSSTNQQPLSNNAINPLYLYRYDSISSETSLNNDRKMHRLSQRQACPSLPKRSVSLPQGEGESDFNNGRVPPRPPLPRSILRKNKVLANKRYSMFEMGDVGEQSEESVEINKRMSLQEPYYMNNDLQLLCRERTIDSEKDVDEIEAERYLKEKLNDITNNANVESETSQHSDDDIKQLEEYLKRSAISSQSSDGDSRDIDNVEVKVRSYVRKFLALRMNKDPLVRNIDMGESQRKTVSFAAQRKKHLDAKLNNLNVVVNEQSHDQAAEDKLIELEEKKKIVSSVNRAVDLLLKYWNADSNHSRSNYNERNECAQICLSNLCPALYAIMSDGLKPHLNSTFGPITNSVWQVVEASSQQGPLTKTLNELVQRINGEDVITEGMLKFHAFVFGLLNLRALDAWFAYLCTRESILRKHYNNSSLFVAALANANVREIVDSLLYILNPLAFCPFHLDLLYQYRQLQHSFGNVNNRTVNAMSFRNADLTKDLESEEMEACKMVSSPKKTRPRSCIAYNMDDKCSIAHKGDLQNAKKRFSAINPKAFYALDKLTSEDSEDYTDSLEHSPLNKRASKQPQSKFFNPDTKSNDNGLFAETKFKKLQEKWELMIGKEGNKSQPSVVMTPSSPVRTFGVVGKSKIPRLLTSPVKQSNVTTNIIGKSSKSPMSGISSLKKPANLPTKTTLKKPMDTKARDVTRRTSRVDQDILGVTRAHTARPSSLPYKSHGVISNDKNLISPHRRAVSTSLPRPTVTTVSRTSVSKHSHKFIR